VRYVHADSGDVQSPNHPVTSNSRKLSKSSNAVPRLSKSEFASVSLSYGATLTLWRCIKLFLPLQRFAKTPNSCSNYKLAFQGWRCTESIMPLHSLQRFPNGWEMHMDFHARFPSSPGQYWLLAPSASAFSFTFVIFVVGTAFFQLKYIFQLNYF